MTTTDIIRCEQCKTETATVYAMDRGAGGWGGRYCESCADDLGFSLRETLTPQRPAPITDPVEASRILTEAPCYAEFIVRSRYTRRPIRLMARDFPRPGRRCTDLTNGTEWFIISAESLERVGFVSMTECEVTK